MDCVGGCGYLCVSFLVFSFSVPFFLVLFSVVLYACELENITYNHYNNYFGIAGLYILLSQWYSLL